MRVPIRLMSVDEFREWHVSLAGLGNQARIDAIRESGAPFALLDNGNFRWTCPDCGSPYLAQTGELAVSGWEDPRWVLTMNATRNGYTAVPSLGCGAMKTEPGHHWWLRDSVMAPA